MNEQTAWAYLSSIDSVIQSIPWSEGAIMYLERISQVRLDEREIRDGICLEYYQHDTQFDLWQRGRVFDKQIELKWEWSKDVFHVVSCGQHIPEGLNLLPLKAERVEETCYYTWGERVKDEDRQLLGLSPDENAFVEVLIPRIFRYPVSQGTWRMQVRVKEFYASDGQLCYARWCGLREEKIR